MTEYCHIWQFDNMLSYSAWRLLRFSTISSDFWEICENLLLKALLNSEISLNVAILPVFRIWWKYWNIFQYDTILFDTIYSYILICQYIHIFRITWNFRTNGRLSVRPNNVSSKHWHLPVINIFFLNLPFSKTYLEPPSKRASYETSWS